MALKDMNGKEFTEGCRFIKPVTLGRSALLEERVAVLKNGKLYSESAKVPIQFPSRCYIID